MDKVIDRFQALMDTATASRDMSAEAIGEPLSIDEHSILEIQNTLNGARLEIQDSANKEGLIEAI